MRTSIKFIVGVAALFILHKILTRQTKTATPIAKAPSNLPESRSAPWRLHPQVSDIGVLQEVQPDCTISPTRTLSSNVAMA